MTESAEVESAEVVIVEVESAEVVIVGGGVMGTSIAFHLAEAGVERVVLLEMNQLGSGSTCKAAGGVRANFSDAVNIALGARSLEAFARFGERPGQEIDLHRVGYLFLLETAEQVEHFRESTELQNRLQETDGQLRENGGLRLDRSVLRLESGGLLPESGVLPPESGGPLPENGGPRPGSGGPRPGSGGPRPGSGGPRPGSGGPRPGSGGPRPGSGGLRPGRDDLRTRMVSVDEAVSLAPIIVPDGLVGACFSPTAGHCTPESVVLGYASAARRLGARVVTGCEVLAIDAVGNQISVVRTSRGDVRTSTVICAAGAWSAQIGAMVGVDLPVVPLRRQIVVTEAIPELPARLPMTIDFGSTFYFHREGPGLLVGMSDPDEEPGFRLNRTDDWIPRLSEAMARRAPSLLDVGLSGGWAGLYEVTPDHNALIGEDGTVSRFLYATGFSGHGFLQGPAVGEVVRDLYLGREPFVDVGPLTAERFRSSGTRTRTRTERNIV